jgi:hypothetical protein
MKIVFVVACGMLLAGCADRRFPAPDPTWHYAFYLPPSKGVCYGWTHSPRYEYQDKTFFDRDTRVVLLHGRFGVAAMPQGECRGRAHTMVVNGLRRRDRIGGSQDDRCRTAIIEKPHWGRFAFAYSGLDAGQAARADAIIDGVYWSAIADLPPLNKNPDEIVPCYWLPDGS